MEYVTVKNADKIIESSSYMIFNPRRYKKEWSKLFGNNNPICLELGMGRGDFIINMCKKFPNKNFIGLELNENQMATAAKRLETQNIKNLKLILADAKDIPEFFGKEIDTIYLTFSEPWPKKIDDKNRFTHPNYLKIYDRVFKKTKHIIMKTDNKGLFAYSLETLSNYWYIFNKVSLDLHNDERQIGNVMTDWEKKCREDGKPIYYLDAIFED